MKQLQSLHAASVKPFNTFTKTFSSGYRVAKSAKLLMSVC